MPDIIVDIPGVGEVEFPDSMSAEDIDKASAELYRQHNTEQEAIASSDNDTALTGLGVGGVIDAVRASKPLIGKAASVVAGSPLAQKVIGAAAGSMVGSVVPIVPGAGTVLGALGGVSKHVTPLVKKAAEGMASWAAKQNAMGAQMWPKHAAMRAKDFTSKGAFSTIGGMLGAESDVLSRLNDPSELQALQDRLSGKPSDRQPDYIDTLAKWFTNVKAAQQVAPNTVLSASEIKQLNQLVENGIPPPIATQTILRLRETKRADGSTKGQGFLGELPRPDGKVSSEISIGVNLDGKEVEIPTLVPTLTQQERNWLLTNDISDPHKIPQSIITKAVDFARQRKRAGQPYFAQPNETAQGATR